MFRRLAWLLVGVSVTTALFLGGYRWWLGRQDRTVDMVLDGRSYQALARKQGVAYQDLLADLKKRGATAVAVAEQDLTSWQEAGLLKAMTGAELRQAAAWELQPASVQALLGRGSVQDGHTYVLTDQAEVAARLRGRLQPEVLRTLAPDLWEIALARDVVSQLTFGFDAEDFQLVQAAGLRPVPRPANFPGAGPGQVDAVFAELGKLAPNARTVIFQGRQLVGFPAAVPATAAAVRAHGWVAGLVEQPSGRGYIVQQGQELLAELVDYRVARVTVRPEAVDGRGARMLYLKGIPPAEVEQIARTLTGRGYELGPPDGLSYVKVGRAVIAVLSLALAGALILLSGGGWTVAVPAVLAALAGPYLAPGAAQWAQAGALGLIPALALLAGPGGSHSDPDSGLAVSWRLARYAGPGVAWVAAYISAALAATLVAGALRGSPPDLLGMTAPPSTGFTVALAAAALAGIYWDTVRWDAGVTTPQLLSGGAALAVLGLVFAFPPLAPALVGAAALAGTVPSPWRQAALTVGLAGAVSLAMAPAQGWLMALTGVGIGLVLYVYHTYRGPVGRRADRGRETA